MGIMRHLQHGLSGRGPHLQTAKFVPKTHPIRLWADIRAYQIVQVGVGQRFQLWR